MNNCVYLLGSTDDNCIFWGTDDNCIFWDTAIFYYLLRLKMLLLELYTESELPSFNSARYLIIWSYLKGEKKRYKIIANKPIQMQIKN